MNWSPGLAGSEDVYCISSVMLKKCTDMEKTIDKAMSYLKMGHCYL